MSRVTVMRKDSEEVHRRVVNHAGRGDSRSPLTDFELEAERKSPEELRAEADKQLKADNWKNAVGPQVNERIAAILERYPWYIDSEKNGRAIAARLSSAEAIQQRRGQQRADNDYSLLEIASAVEAMAAEGQLQINEAEAQKGRIEAYSEQLAAVPRGEDDLYQISMNELRALANGNNDPLGQSKKGSEKWQTVI